MVSAEKTDRRAFLWVASRWLCSPARGAEAGAPPSGAEPKPQEASLASKAAAKAEAKKERTPRLDGAGLLGLTNPLSTTASGQ